jgi:3,4-dihydroxy 2-butanone 4-phosphate synthase/GTP cyclohydrolase II
VRERAGHTEAALELVQLAGLPEVAVICEIADDDGEMARGPALRRFAARHGLLMLTIDELTEHVRAEAERLVAVADAAVRVGGRLLAVVTYRDPVDGTDHRAIAAPAQDAGRTPALVAVHAECFAGDVLGGSQCCCAQRLEDAIAAVAAHPGGGVVAYVRDVARSGSCPLPAPLDSLRRQARLAGGMLRDLGIDRAGLLDGSPGMRAALSATGIRLTAERLTLSGPERRRSGKKVPLLQAKADMPNVLDTRRQAR